MLAKVLGPNRATVRVDIVLDHSSVTSTSEVYDPQAKVATKEEIKTKSGPASAGPAEAGAAPGGPTKEETNSTDYLVGRTVKQEVIVPGKVTSISVAAVVDLSAPAAPPAAAGEAAKPPAAPALKVEDIEALIRSALGLKETDTIKVVQSPFQQAIAPEAEAEAGGASESRAFYIDIAKHSSLGVLVIGALVALKIFSGPRKRPATTATASLAGGAAAGGGTAALPAPAAYEGDPALLRSRITDALQENPEEVKRLFMAWVDGEKGEA
jgi:flagellar M-ring protein FliF